MLLESVKGPRIVNPRFGLPHPFQQVRDLRVSVPPKFRDDLAWDVQANLVFRYQN